jgi:aldehyde dehydrogenase (NAD+)
MKLFPPPAHLTAIGKGGAMDPRALTRTLEAQRAFFASGATLDLAFRLQALGTLEEAVQAHEERINQALHRDFRKSPFEAYVTEVGLVLGEIRHHRRRLKAWARPRRVPGGLANFPSACRVHREPFGQTLILAPWNYPFQLSLAPLVGAISAGNCAVVKPSEHAEHTAGAIADLLAEAFPPEHVTTVLGGRAEAQALLDERFDLIFFTGSTALGRMVMERAARHLTPVVLELGGKSPCVVDEDADLEVAARRIAWGKFLNAGQTCVAPDHLLVHTKVRDRMVELLKERLVAMYGPDPRRSPDYPRIINGAHLARLKALMASGRILHGGELDEEDRYLAPTLLGDLGPEAPALTEEIFGPLLPILPFRDLDEAIARVNAGPKPLALYYFSRSASRQAKVLRETASGSACFNETVAHLASRHLPFGGVGLSGMGSYHGWYSFDAFSHRRSVLRKPTWLDLPLRYAPYAGKLPWIRKLLG